jgi:DNA-binding HxlR family transcriptional regulator
VHERSYNQYCGVARALDLVGDRWALLVVRDLLLGPKRYTDLARTLPGIGTNILSARLRSLQDAGVIRQRTLPPPAASTVYELTDYGRELKTALRELALWGARSLGPPTAEHELFPGWLANAVDVVLAPLAPPGRFEFRIGDEVASIVDGEARTGPVLEPDGPDVVVEGDPQGLYHMFVDRRLDLVSVRGDRDLLARLLDVAPTPVEAPLGV